MTRLRCLVLDDDPTGTQTVSGVPVFTDLSDEGVRHALEDPAPTVFLLTNSRALDADQSEALHRRIGALHRQSASDRLLVSRSDSTLRGHFPLEPQALGEAAGGYDAIVLAPFFAEGGRITRDDVHYVRVGDDLVPCAQTEFARDATFGFSASNLRDWVREKSGGALHTRSLSLEALRGGAKDLLIELMSARGGEVIIVNAEFESDLRALMCPLGEAVRLGKRFVFRSAASWVRVVSGQHAAPLLRGADLGAEARPGLILCGSHVARTTRQIERLRQIEGLETIEWRVECARQRAGSDAKSIEANLEAEARRCAAHVEAAFANGRDALVLTTRALQVPGDEEALEFSRRVSRGLSDVLGALTSRPGWIVAKGGITSSDGATRGLSLKRALVRGQIEPGVPLWRADDPQSRFPGIAYAVFPGNVGDDDTLRAVVQTLREGSRANTSPSP